jgi:hypothetical protein
VRQLLDSGWTVDELARALKATPERIRQYVSGKAVPEPITQRDLLRMVTTYLKRTEAEGRVPPRIVSENHQQNPPDLSPERGVYVEEIHAPEETWYKVVTSKGKVGTVHLPDELVDAGLYENLCRRLDTKDPVSVLKAV